MLEILGRGVEEPPDLEGHRRQVVSLRRHADQIADAHANNNFTGPVLEAFTELQKKLGLAG